MFTFKPQAKQNAKRFLVKTAKVENFEEYLTQDADGAWGCYLGADGLPATAAAVAEWHMNAEKAAMVPSAEEAAALNGATVEDALDDTPADPFSAAFGALAMSQLTAPSNTATPVEAPKANREGATPTSGLRIQKDRPEQNGVRRQSEGSVGDKLWALYDKAGRDVTLEQAKALAESADLNPTSAAIALYNWRKFHGIVGVKK